MGYICGKQVGCRVAFASRLAPTVGLSTSAENRSAVGSPSRAGSLLQLDGVHLRKTGRLSGRLREQAHSYSWMGYTCGKQVGCQAAFASRLAPVGWGTPAENRSAFGPPSRAGSLLQLDLHLRKQVDCQAAFASRLAPTVGWGTPAENRSAVGPPSRAGSLPQLDGVHLQKTGRLSGRLREQARSHSWIEYTCGKQVGCQAAFASRLAPTVGLSTYAENRSAVRPPSRAGSLPQLD
jgi:hypothetical protein